MTQISDRPRWALRIDVTLVKVALAWLPTITLAWLASMVATAPAIAQNTNSQPLTSSNWARQMFETTSHDFRTVGRGAKTEFYFTFTNPYKEDVRVASVRTSCGCTTPILTQSVLRSRESAAVIAKFNTDTHIGDKAATLTVVFDRPYYNEVQLTVRGHIRTDVSFSPAEINFGEFAAGQIKRQEVIVSHVGPGNWEIRDVRSLCHDLTVSMGPAERGPNRVRYRLVIGTKSSMPEGDIRERLTLVTNDQRFPTIDMAVSGRVRPSLQVSPAAVSLGQVAADGNAERRLVIRGEETFAIADVHCDDPRFSFEIPEGSRNMHFVKVFFNADGSGGDVHRTIEITTDSGRKAECVITGSVTP